MTPLKFRAWLSKEKRMLAFPLDKDGQCLTLVVDDGKVHWLEYPGGTQREASWMQSTGLTDRNGVEIYEGDILGIEDDEDRTRCSVAFDRGAFCKRYEADDDIKEAFCSRFDDSDNDFWIVIGNIHENPDLLPQQP